MRGHRAADAVQLLKPGVYIRALNVGHAEIVYTLTDDGKDSAKIIIVNAMEHYRKAFYVISNCCEFGMDTFDV